MFILEQRVFQVKAEATEKKYHEIISSALNSIAAETRPLMCGDVQATVPQDYFALCSGWVFREVKLICHSNVINPPVNV